MRVGADNHGLCIPFPDQANERLRDRDMEYPGSAFGPIGNQSNRFRVVLRIAARGVARRVMQLRQIAISRNESTQRRGDLEPRPPLCEEIYDTTW